MSFPTVFANLAGGTQPASLLDSMFNVCGQMGNIGCTAAGTNAITLTPNTNFFLPTSYANYQMATFVAAATSTGAVTIQIGAIGFVNLYNANGVQANANDITINLLYTVVYNSALNSGGGGFIIVSATAAAVSPPPQGYLTLVSATPIIASDTTVSAGSAMFYTPYTGNSVPVWNGAVWVATVFSELSLTLNAAQLASNLYDVFLFNNAGTLTLVTGPTWTTGGGSITAGSCARGTGAGSTQLSRVQGFWTNTVAITGRNGATTFPVSAGFGTYLGTVFMDTSNGAITCHRSYGQSRKWGVWNAYNRVPIYLKGGDSTATWTYNTNTTRASNNAAANVVTTLTGLQEETQDLSFLQKVQFSSASVANATGAAIIGIGINSTTTNSGYNPVVESSIQVAANATLLTAFPAGARYLSPPLLGINNIQSTENTTVATGITATYSGTEQNMLLSATWRG